jgi:hypothetical protein
MLENKGGKLVPFREGWNWDHPTLLKSVEAIARLPFKWVCTAHGSPIERGDLI